MNGLNNKRITYTFINQYPFSPIEDKECFIKLVVTESPVNITTIANIRIEYIKVFKKTVKTREILNLESTRKYPVIKTNIITPSLPPKQAVAEIKLLTFNKNESFKCQNLNIPCVLK